MFQCRLEDGDVMAEVRFAAHAHGSGPKLARVRTCDGSSPSITVPQHRHCLAGTTYSVTFDPSNKSYHGEDYIRTMDVSETEQVSFPERVKPLMPGSERPPSAPLPRSRPLTYLE